MQVPCALAAGSLRSQGDSCARGPAAAAGDDLAVVLRLDHRLIADPVRRCARCLPHGGGGRALAAAGRPGRRRVPALAHVAERVLLAEAREPGPEPLWHVTPA